MVRTQIQLTEAQARALKAYSAQTGLSMAEIIRRSIDQTVRSNAISADERRQRAIAVPAFHGGPPDLAREHDKYYVEAIEAKWNGRIEDRS